MSSERRRQILSAALECFNQAGIEAASIQDISARSGASVGSIYHHFGNKEGLAQSLLAEGLRSNAEELARTLEHVEGAQAGINAVVTKLMEWIARNPEWARYIYTASRSGVGEEKYPALIEVNQFYNRLINEYFQPYRQAGVFRELPEACFAPLVLGPVHYFARRWLNNGLHGPFLEFAQHFSAAAWRAVANESHSEPPP